MFKSETSSMVLVVLAVTLNPALTQTVPPLATESAERLGSISGVVKDDVGEPIQGASISARAAGVSTPSKTATTDAQGHYKVADLAPGRHHIFMFVRREPFGFGRRRKIVSLSAGQDLESVDFRLQRQGEIVGRVLDENDEPLPGVDVYLVGSAYQRGQLQHRFRSIEKTDDRGEYRIHRNVKGGDRAPTGCGPAGRLPGRCGLCQAGSL